MPPLAVIFRFDGVLADTANVRVAAWQRTFRVLGWVESDETCARGITLPDEAFAREVFARRKVQGGDPTGWAERQQGLALQLLRDRPLLMPGVAALIHALRDRGVALAVVSPAPDEQVTTVLAASGLLDSFDARVTGADADADADADSDTHADADAASAGAAEQAALRDLGIAPDRALALVATPAQREAAGRAGLSAVVVAPTRPADLKAQDDSSSPPAWLANLADLAATLAALEL